MAVLAADTRHVDTGMYAALDAATTTPVYRTPPSGAAYPLTRFICISETDSYVLAGRAWGRFIYQIDTWAKSGSAVAAQDIAGNIAAALMTTKPTVTGGRVTYCRREQRRETDPTTDGIQYQRVSEDWAIEVIPT